MTPKYETIIFDVDGTLLKSEEGVFNSLRYVAGKMGISLPPDSVCLKFIGPPLQYSFQNILGMSGEDAAKAVALYDEYYLPKGVFESELYPGMLALVETLCGLGAKVCVATAKNQQMADSVMSHFRLAPFISHMAVKDNTIANCDKKETIRQVMTKASAKKETTVMVGDTLYDAQGAANNGIGFIGVTYGYGTKSEMEPAGAALFADGCEQLAALLLHE